MAGDDSSVAEHLRQLDTARKLVLGDAAYYPQIVQGILPIIGATARLELRRWGADFLSETFASPALPQDQKQTLCLLVLDTLNAMLDVPTQDTQVLKSVIQTAASVYPLVFKHILVEEERQTLDAHGMSRLVEMRLCDQYLMCLDLPYFSITHPADSTAWDTMSSIKSKILRRWDTAALGVRICCIKFVQRVILVQTTGAIADPRRPEKNEISLAMVPRSHPLIPPPNLEAESSGLLDRMLDIFHESAGDPVLIDATLNALSLLIRSRPLIAHKIVTAILNFNPLKQAKTPMSPKMRVLIKSMERTTRSLLVNVNKLNPSGPLSGKIQQYVERLIRSRSDIFEEHSRKRPAPAESTDGLDASKRARLAPGVPSPQIIVPPLPPGPTSFGQLFTITGDQALSSFDVTQLPIDMVVKIAVPVLYRLDPVMLEEALRGIRSRYVSLSQATSIPTGIHLDVEDDDDYEPDFQPAEDEEQIINKLDNAAPEPEYSIALGPFQVPQPPPLTQDEAAQVGQGTISRVFGVMSALEVPTPTKKSKTGINRLAASTYDRDAWITLITRLATRAPTGLEPAMRIKTEDGALETNRISLSNNIRESLYQYVMEDFRNRINTAIAWLNEEWYNDQMQSRLEDGGPTHYDRWMLKVLDGFLPFLDAKDKVFTRFLSEIPSINEAVVERVKKLASDPERVALSVNTLHYLVLLRPPVRTLCLNALVDMWENYEDAKPSVAKVLIKWRPEVLKPIDGKTDAPHPLPIDGKTDAPHPSLTSSLESVTAGS